MRSPRSKRVRASVAAWLTAAAWATGCSGAGPGPAFVRAEPPPAHRARLYLYRADPRHSPSSVRVTLDGRDLGRLRNGEYETMEVSAGLHRLRAGLRSIAFVAWGWNEQRIRLTPGETVYVKLSVRLTERAGPDTRSLEIAGRAGGVASENVYLQNRGAEEALRELAATTRRMP